MIRYGRFGEAKKTLVSAGIQIPARPARIVVTITLFRLQDEEMLSSVFETPKSVSTNIHINNVNVFDVIYVYISIGIKAQQDVIQGLRNLLALLHGVKSPQNQP